VTPRPSLRALFSAFFAIALSGFGGTLPFARRTLVDRLGWLTPEDFTETLSLCQSLPGPNIVNMSIVVGSRAQGWRGSVAAASGLIGTPVIIVIILGALYSRFEPLLKTRPWIAAPFILLAFVAVALLRLPLPYVLLVLAPISIVLAWRWHRRA